MFYYFFFFRWGVCFVLFGFYHEILSICRWFPIKWARPISLVGHIDFFLKNSTLCFCFPLSTSIGKYFYKSKNRTRCYLMTNILTGYVIYLLYSLNTYYFIRFKLLDFPKYSMNLISQGHSLGLMPYQV